MSMAAANTRRAEQTENMPPAAPGQVIGSQVVQNVLHGFNPSF
jgi:hypothetical protein